MSDALENVLGAEPAWMESSPDTASQYRMERDAWNVALGIASFDREQALPGTRVPAEPSHFSSIPLVAVNEDSIIVDDLNIFPGWQRLHDLRPAGRLFWDPSTSRRLAVLQANKNELETTSGADLLYFVHDYQSFVLVQYKRVKRENNKKILRLDHQLDKQLECMIKVEELCRQPAATPGSLDDHRLSDALCFFKLCETDQPARATDLSLGKYVSLDVWNLMAAKGMMRGENDGRRLLYDDVNRYLNNTAFAELVSEGWVGSTSRQYEWLLDYLFESYEAGRAVIIGSLELGTSRRRLQGRQPDLQSRPVTLDRAR